MERRLSAILAADMVGYSRLVGIDEEGTISRHNRYRGSVLEPKIGEFNGRIVKLIGDGMLAEFASAVDATQCAVDIQREMHNHEEDQPEDRRIVYRIGVNLGDVIIDGDDIMGDGVNIAARLETLADPGGVCISSKVHDEVASKINVAFDDLGEQAVKNIAQPVRAWRWGGDDAL